MPSHVFEDHTAEVRLRITAPTLAGLFEEAGRAIAELMLEAASSQALGSEQTVSLHAPDREALLVDWINEIIYLSETTGRVFTEFQVLEVSDTSIVASMSGVVPDAMRTLVKAATLHEVCVRATASGYDASVVLDV